MQYVILTTLSVLILFGAMNNSIEKCLGGMPLSNYSWEMQVFESKISVIWEHSLRKDILNCSSAIKMT